MIAPKSVLLSAVLFLVVVLVFRYVSLGSIVAVAAFPNIALALHEYGNRPVALVLMALASVLIILKHRANIIRLVTGTENRVGARQAVNQGNQ
jgi:glycerol-3-phosphate acyltransferase PlsY